jgi:hypothetical protein
MIDFTTGDVAKICQVAPRTVVKWTQSGLLKCYAVPRPLDGQPFTYSPDRRIARPYLVKFMLDHGIPLRWLGRCPQKLTEVEWKLAWADLASLFGATAFPHPAA